MEYNDDDDDVIDVEWALDSAIVLLILARRGRRPLTFSLLSLFLLIRLKNGFWSNNVEILGDEGKVVVAAGTKEFVQSNNEITNNTARRRLLFLVVTVG